MNELVNRRDVEKAFDNVFGLPKDHYESDRYLSFKKIIGSLPSAQPEPLTDREKRIFLSAMSREDEVCKQVDDEWRDCREPYDDSLVKTCHEITRKVKGALWA